jgi:diaminopimelate epimerase
MQALGNDFVVFDGVNQRMDLNRGLVRFLCDRHFGIGCDQLLIVEPPRRPDTDFYYRIYNSDGGEVAQCGNGARCLARFVHDKGLTAKTEVRVETASGMIILRLEPDGQVTVNLGAPKFEPREIPFDAPRRAPTYGLEVQGKQIEASVLSLGNPHAVQFVEDVENAPVVSEGAVIERHSRFPERVNAGYAQVLSRGRLKVRVYERGAGETLACGSGACAAAVAGIGRGLLDADVIVNTRGGDLGVRWGGEGEPVFMTGPALSVFEGQIELTGGQGHAA